MPPWPSLKVKDGAKYGPLVPTLGAQVFASGLGGGIYGGPGQFGASEDYQLSLGWRVAPRGLFDRGQADWQWGATAHGADLQENNERFVALVGEDEQGTALRAILQVRRCSPMRCLPYYFPILGTSENCLPPAPAGGQLFSD